MYNINVNKLEFKKFPGGELHITNKWYEDMAHSFGDLSMEQRINNIVQFQCRINSSDDFMKLALFTNAYKSMGMQLPELYLPYIPYARQDRIAKNGEALSIKVFAQLLNSLEYPRVTVLDPHSDVCTALINNVHVIPQDSIWGTQLGLILGDLPFDLISPDAGALKKIYKLNDKLHSDNIRIGMKHRDTQTGMITETTVSGEKKNNIGVIVDDICDGGRTFIELAKVLDYDRLILCITHGIFSNGFDQLFEHFDNIYTTNSWNGDLTDTGKLKVISL